MVGRNPGGRQLDVVERDLVDRAVEEEARATRPKAPMNRLLVVSENVGEPTLVVTSTPSLYTRVVAPSAERVTTQ